MVGAPRCGGDGERPPRGRAGAGGELAVGPSQAGGQCVEKGPPGAHSSGPHPAVGVSDPVHQVGPDLPTGVVVVPLFKTLTLIIQGQELTQDLNPAASPGAVLSVAAAQGCGDPRPPPPSGLWALTCDRTVSRLRRPPPPGPPAGSCPSSWTLVGALGLESRPRGLCGVARAGGGLWTVCGPGAAPLRAAPVASPSTEVPSAAGGLGTAAEHADGALLEK